MELSHPTYLSLSELFIQAGGQAGLKKEGGKIFAQRNYFEYSKEDN
jgi:hypothetical protein